MRRKGIVSFIVTLGLSFCMNCWTTRFEAAGRPIPNETACPNLGRLTPEQLRTGFYSEESGAEGYAIRTKSGTIAYVPWYFVYQIDSLASRPWKPEPRDYLSHYDNVCGSKPPFWKELSFAQAVDAELDSESRDKELEGQAASLRSEVQQLLPPNCPPSYSEQDSSLQRDEKERLCAANTAGFQSLLQGRPVVFKLAEFMDAKPEKRGNTLTGSYLAQFRLTAGTNAGSQSDMRGSNFTDLFDTRSIRIFIIYRTGRSNALTFQKGLLHEVSGHIEKLEFQQPDRLFGTLNVFTFYVIP